MTIPFHITGVGIALAIIAIIITVTIQYVWATHHRQRPVRSILAFFHWHLPLPLFLIFITGLFVTATFSYGLGGRFDKNKKIIPAASLLKAGGAAPWSYDLGKYLPVVQNQGTSNACGAFATTEAQYVWRAEHGEVIPDVGLSAWYTYYYAASGTNNYTTLDQEAVSTFQHGLVTLSAQPHQGQPSSIETKIARGFGGSYRYLFYQPAGYAAIPVIKAEIAQGNPVLLLITIGSDLENAFGIGSTGDGGAYRGTHFVLAYAYAGDTIYIRNSWGTGFGNQGNIALTPQAVETKVLAAGIVTPSSVAWPKAIVRPVVHPKTMPKPAPKPTPKRAPAPVHHASYIVTTAQSLRVTSYVSLKKGSFVKKGWTVLYLGKKAHGSLYVTTLNHHVGWITASHVRLLHK